MQMIMAANACLISALYKILYDDFLADFIRKFIDIIRDNVDFGTDSQKRTKVKNTVVFLSLLYDFEILHEDFLGELVVYISDHLNEDMIDIIQLVISNAGFKIRENSPGSIKV